MWDVVDLVRFTQNLPPRLRLKRAEPRVWQEVILLSIWEVQERKGSHWAVKAPEGSCVLSGSCKMVEFRRKREVTRHSTQRASVVKGCEA